MSAPTSPPIDLDSTMESIVVALRTRRPDTWPEVISHFLFALRSPDEASSDRLRGPLQRFEALLRAADPISAADVVAGEIRPLLGGKPVSLLARTHPEEPHGPRWQSQIEADRELAWQRSALPEDWEVLVLVGCARSLLLESMARDGKSIVAWEPDDAGRRAAQDLSARYPNVELADETSAPTTNRIAWWIHPAVSERDARTAVRYACQLQTPAPTTNAGSTRRSGTIALLTLGRDFHGVAEITRALGRRGREVQVVDATDGQSAVTLLARSRPTGLLSINGRALRRSPELRAFLDASDLPCAVWFVDDPEVAMQDSLAELGGRIKAFAWERSAVARLRALGFDDASFLPLACDPAALDRARQLNPYPNPPAIAWVASSYAGEDRPRTNLGEGERSLVDAFAQVSARDRRVSPSAVRIALAHWAGLETVDANRLLQIQAMALDTSAANRRGALARALLPLGLQIYGDPGGWQRVLGGTQGLNPDVAYRSHVPGLYSAAGLCVDLPHPQMPTAVTQRAFDVPACHGLLLAEDTSDLREHFDVGTEVLAFETVEHARDMAAWALANPEPAMRMRQRAHDRARGEHTYDQRVARLLDRMGF